jgi:hypothetical protein
MSVMSLATGSPVGSLHGLQISRSCDGRKRGEVRGRLIGILVPETPTVDPSEEKDANPRHPSIRETSPPVRGRPAARRLRVAVWL